MNDAIGQSAMVVAVLLASGASAATRTPARPVGNPSDWISASDYPVSALKTATEGVVRFQLDVNTEGHVAGCTILQHSGSEALDTATCSLLSARATFFPATDKNGQPIASTFTRAVRWLVPNDGGQGESRAHFETCRLGTENAIIVETAFGCIR